MSEVTDQVSLYAEAVIARPLRMHWFFMKYLLRLEKIAPLLTKSSLATTGSEMTTKSWLAIQIENRDPNCFAHLSRRNQCYILEDIGDSNSRMKSKFRVATKKGISDGRARRERISIFIEKIFA